MQHEKMSHFIAERRKEMGLTQKALAEQLNVTDKAVSKWERGLSCPDISLLAKLSEVLGVTTGELLSGGREASGEPAPEVEVMVETTLQYADTAAKSRAKNLRVWFGFGYTILSFLGILTCAIVDFAVQNASVFTWSLVPITAIVFVWLVLLPVLLRGKRGVWGSLLVLTVLELPFLWVLEGCLLRLLGAPVDLMSIGFRVSIAGFVLMWAIYLLFAKTRLYPYAAATATALLVILASIYFNDVINSYLGEPNNDVWDLMSYAILIAGAAIFFVAGWVRRKRLFKPRAVRMAETTRL